MKKLISILSLAGMLGLGSLNSAALNWRVAGYGTYWDGDLVGGGWGGGAKGSLQVLGFLVGDVRAGYVQFDNFNTSMVPLEASINLKIPFNISPYGGIGAGYYFTESDNPLVSDSSGYFAQLGAEFEMGRFGIFAEGRYNDIEGSAFDGPSVNVGVSFKF